MDAEKLKAIQETLRQSQMAQSSNWGYRYYQDVTWLLSQLQGSSHELSVTNL